MKMLNYTNLLGAVVTIILYVSAILVFVVRLIDKPEIGHWFGLIQFLMLIPMLYLLIKAPSLNRPVLYYIQICLMLSWLIVEAFLDYFYKVDFRQVRWMVIGYVTLFFAGTGGMLGVVAYAGRGWSISAVILFLVMAVLAFVQRSVTGM